MGCGLVAGYGMFASFIGRFLFPGQGRRTQPQYVTDLGSFKLGDSMTYVSPGG